MNAKVILAVTPKTKGQVSTSKVGLRKPPYLVRKVGGVIVRRTGAPVGVGARKAKQAYLKAKMKHHAHQVAKHEKRAKDNHPKADPAKLQRHREKLAHTVVKLAHTKAKHEIKHKPTIHPTPKAAHAAEMPTPYSELRNEAQLQQDRRRIFQYIAKRGVNPAIDDYLEMYEDLVMGNLDDDEFDTDLQYGSYDE